MPLWWAWWCSTHVPPTHQDWKNFTYFPSDRGRAAGTWCSASTLFRNCLGWGALPAQGYVFFSWLPASNTCSTGGVRLYVLCPNSGQLWSTRAPSELFKEWAETLHSTVFLSFQIGFLPFHRYWSQEYFLVNFLYLNRYLRVYCLGNETCKSHSNMNWVNKAIP